MTELKITQADRFWSKVDVRGENDCWRWLGSKTAKGYGLVSKRRATHIALELSGKPRPESARLVRHHCDNPICVNPSHLEWGTDAQNVEDMILRKRHHANRRSHCIHGHPFSGDNLKIRRNGQRSCRECLRTADLKYKARAALARVRGEG